MTTSRLLTGLSAFPLTPIADDAVDERAFVRIVERLATAGVDSITALGSTGSYVYLDRDERRRAVELAVAGAGGVPVLAGIGHVRMREVLRHADDAQAAGAAALLLAPVTYQALTDDEVLTLFADVSAAVSVPVVVYDNPGTTHVSFSDELHARISRLPHVEAVKIPPVIGGVDVVRARLDSLRSAVGPGVAIGISGDAVAADALVAGCDAWYSVLAGTLPGPCRAIVDAAAAGDAQEAQRLSGHLGPLWRLFGAHGSYRVVAGLAEELGLVTHPCLPRPVLALDEGGRADVRAALAALRDDGLVEP